MLYTVSSALANVSGLFQISGEIWLAVLVLSYVTILVWIRSVLSWVDILDRAGDRRYCTMEDAGIRRGDSMTIEQVAWGVLLLMEAGVFAVVVYRMGGKNTGQALFSCL